MDSASQVIIVRYGSHTLGLLVSELHGVPQFDPSLIIPSPIAGKALITHVIKANDGQLLIQSVNTACLFNQLMGVQPMDNNLNALDNTSLEPLRLVV